MVHRLSTLSGRQVSVFETESRNHAAETGTRAPGQSAPCAASSPGLRREAALTVLLRPLGLSLAALVLVPGLTWFGMGYIRSGLRHLDYALAVHPDRSEMLPTPGRQVPEAVTLIL